MLSARFDRLVSILNPDFGEDGLLTIVNGSCADVKFRNDLLGGSTLNDLAQKPSFMVV